MSKMFSMEGLAAYGRMLAVAMTAPFDHAQNDAALELVKALIRREIKLSRVRFGDGFPYRVTGASEVA